MSKIFRNYLDIDDYPLNYRKIKAKSKFRNTVYLAMKRRKWKITDDEVKWDIYWAEKDWI